MLEAVTEDLAVKQELLRELSDRQPSTTLLASNTSSLDIDRLADAVASPERVWDCTSSTPRRRWPRRGGLRSADRDGVRRLRGRARALLGQDAGPLPQHPGFVVNRVARPFYGEAFRMLADGVADAATLDAALRGAGFRLGPLELTDLIGQDVNLAVGTSVWEQTQRDPRYARCRSSRTSSRRGGSAARAATASTRTTPPGTPRTSSRRGARHRARRRTGHDRPRRPHPGHARQRGRRPRRPRRGERGGRRPRDAARRRLPRGPLEWGREIGYDVVEQQLRELDPPSRGTLPTQPRADGRP